MSETTALSQSATATIARIRELTGKAQARVGWPEEFARLTLAVVQNPMLNGETVRPRRRHPDGSTLTLRFSDQLTRPHRVLAP